MVCGFYPTKVVGHVHEISSEWLKEHYPFLSCLSEAITAIEPKRQNRGNNNRIKWFYVLVEVLNVPRRTVIDDYDPISLSVRQHNQSCP